MNFEKGITIGLVAQEVEPLFPEAVSDNHHPGPTNNDNKFTTEGIDYKGLDYTKLIPITIRAIQEQQEIINSLKAEIEELHKENTGLKADLSSFDKRLEQLENVINTKASKK